VVTAKDSVLTGSAGEHYVLYRLHRQGVLAAQSPAGARDADVLVSTNAVWAGVYRSRPGLMERTVAGT
jgi:hypothetical protein